MKKLIAILVACLLMSMVPMAMADSDDIVVTMDPQATADVYVNQTAWSPSCAIAGTESTSATWGLLQNNGTCDCNVTVKATDSANWTLEDAEGHNQFELDILGGNAIGLTTEDQVFEDPLEANLQGGYQITFGLKVDMPTSSSVSASQESTITFTATVN